MSYLLDFRQPFREQGVWWLPSAPDDHVAGTLTFNQDEGGALALVGVFGNIRDSLSVGRREIPTIHGLTMKGKRITIFKGSRRTGNYNFPGVANEIYHAPWILTGYHASSFDECAYTGSDFRFDSIEKWLDHRRFKRVPSPSSEGLPYGMDNIDPRILSTIGDFTLTSNAISTVNSRDGNELSAKSESIISISSVDPQSLSWHLGVATKLQSLASLCAGKHLPLSALRLKGPLEQISDDHAERPDIDILVAMVGGNSRVAKENDPYVFTVDTLIDHSGDAISQWYSAYDQIAPALNLYFAIIGYNQTFSNIRFVLAVQALEVYHRRTASVGLIDAAEYENLVSTLTAAIPASTPRDMREKLCRTLEFANEPSLGQRIKAITKPLKVPFGKNPVGMSKSYISKIVSTRNYNTHFSEKTKESAMFSAELHWATRRIVTLLTIVLFRHIGVSSDTIHEAMKTNQEFALLLASEGVPPL